MKLKKEKFEIFGFKRICIKICISAYLTNGHLSLVISELVSWCFMGKVKFLSFKILTYE